MKWGRTRSFIMEETWLVLRQYNYVMAHYVIIASIQPTSRLIMFELRQYNLRHGPLCSNCVNTTYVMAHYVSITYMVLGTLRDLLYGSGTLRDLLYGSETLRDSLYGSRDTSWLIIWFAGHFVTHYMVLGTLRDLLYGSGTLRDLLYGSGTLRDSLYGSRDTSWLIIWFAGQIRNGAIPTWAVM